MAARFGRFSERARRVLSLAQEEAQRLKHNYIGTEHILLGLVREVDGVAARALSNLSIELSKVRSDVEFIIDRGERRASPGEIGLTPRAKKVIELAVDEARRLDHHNIGTEHLLIGIMREEEGVAAGVLENLGASLNTARDAVKLVLEKQERRPGGEGAGQRGPAIQESEFARVVKVHIRELTLVLMDKTESDSNLRTLILREVPALQNSFLALESGHGSAFKNLEMLMSAVRTIKREAPVTVWDKVRDMFMHPVVAAAVGPAVTVFILGA